MIMTLKGLLNEMLRIHDGDKSAHLLMPCDGNLFWRFHRLISPVEILQCDEIGEPQNTHEYILWFHF